MLSLLLCFTHVLQKFLAQILHPIIDNSLFTLSCKCNYLRRYFLRSTLPHHLASIVFKTGRFEPVTGQTGWLDSPAVETGQATRLPRAFRLFFRKTGPNRPVRTGPGRLGSNSSADPHFRRQLCFRADLEPMGGLFPSKNTLPNLL